MPPETNTPETIILLVSLQEYCNTLLPNSNAVDIAARNITQPIIIPMIQSAPATGAMNPKRDKAAINPTQPPLAASIRASISAATPNMTL